VLHQGAVIKDGTTEAIRRDPDVKRLYFGSHVPAEKAAEV
jgi:ABC-type branched-subunit amino acid transport system ATPase component